MSQSFLSTKGSSRAGASLRPVAHQSASPLTKWSVTEPELSVRLVVVGDGAEIGVGGSFRGAEIRAGDAVVPGEFVFVPLDPQESEEKSAGREHVAGCAEKELARGRLPARKIDDAETTQHHAGRGTAENGEEGEVLQIDDGEGDGIDGGVEFAEGEVSAERAEEGEESTTGEKETGGVNEAGETALFDGRDRVLAGVLVNRPGLRLSG